jgi:serine/threonine protein kinase
VRTYASYSVSQEPVGRPGAIPPIGTVLWGTYRIVRAIAGGGCGEVFAAAHTRLGCEVAIKFLHPNLAGPAQALARFWREAETASTIRHPHIVQILDFNVSEQDVPFLVMELLEGRPLTKDMVSGTPFEPADAIHIVDQIAQGMQAAHAHGIVHLDLKPDNVILISMDGRDDFVKVIDFGISQASWRQRPVDEPNVAGTPEFMAPEQAAGLVDEIDHRTDQFSLASLAYTLLTGEMPFSGRNLGALLLRVMSEAPVPPSQRVPWLGPGVDAVLAQAMSKRSADRYSSIVVFAEALRLAVDGLATVQRRVTSAPASGRHFERPATVPASQVVDDPMPSRRLNTAQFIRTARRQFRGRKSRVILLALAAAAVFAWFSPFTRDVTRAAWHQAEAEARRMIGRPSAIR